MAEQQAIGKALLISDDVIKRLDEADKKINKIAEDSSNMAKVFSSAMGKMSGSADSLLSRLEKVHSIINALGKTNFNGIEGLNKAANDAEKVASSVTKAASAMNKYSKAASDTDSERKAYVERYKMYERMFDQIERNEKRQIQAERRVYEEQAKAYRQQNYKQNTTVSGSLAFAGTANTYARRAQAIKYLEEAMKRLSTADRDYNKNLSALSAAHNKLISQQKELSSLFQQTRTSQSGLMNTSEQLARKLALLFSVSQIQGYIEKLIEVRGQFELQNAALASILQNKDKADLLFGQITQLAVKSPFTIMELNSYTKQLAAYSVEYDKIYDTTKMLADVSAGLGVDMQRLILAFGQVKAANYLRGTETRQFTEAGINMLGELSKYYSELEGRMVSVAEVQDRQYRRLISFKDVEEVFKRLTSAGGMFYDMQEKQSETLAGEWSNLKDSIDLMFNDIGKDNQGILNDVIKSVKYIIENWRTVADVVAPIVTALLAQKVVVGNIIPLVTTIASSIGNVVKSIRAARDAQVAFNLASSANAWVTVGAVVLGIILEVKNALSEANREQERYNNIASEGYYDAVTSAANYKRLADVVSSSTASYQEQKDALDELKRTYSEILPQHYLEADAIRAMKGNYDEATAAIMNYVRAKTQEKELQAISEDYEPKVQDAQTDLAERLQKNIQVMYKYKIAMSDLNAVFAKFREEWDSGKIKDFGQGMEELSKLLSQRTGLNINLDLMKSFEGFKFNSVQSLVQDYYDSLVDMKQKTDEAISSSNMKWGDKITIELQNQRKQLDNQVNEVNSLLDVVASKGKKGSAGELITQEQVNNAKKRLMEYADAWGIPEERIKELKGGAYEISEISKAFNIAALRTFAKEIGSMRVPKSQLASALMFLQGIRKEIASFDSTPFQRYVSGIISSSAQLNRISLDALVDVFARADESLGDYTKRMQGSLASLLESISLYKRSPYLIPEWSGKDGKKLEQEAEKRAKVIQSVISSITVPKASSTSSKKSASAAKKAQKSQLDMLKERIDLIKKAGEEYKKLLDYYDKEDAKSRVVSAFKDSFKELGISIDMDFDTSGIIKKIEGLSNKAGKAGAKAKKGAVSNLKTERDIKFKEEGLDEIQKKVDDIFSDYEFTLDMKTQGIDLDSFKNMLRAVGASDTEIDSLGLKSTSFEDVQKQLREEIASLQKQGGKKQIDEANKIQKQLTDLEVKEAKKRFEELLKLREKYQSNEEKITKIESDIEGWQKELDDINKLGDAANKEQKELLQMRIQNGEDAILKLKSEDLQLTDFWRQLFGDLEDLSVGSLRNLSRIVDEIIASAKEIKGSKGETVGYSSSYKGNDGTARQVTLTVEQYQRLLKRNNQVADEIQKKNPFIALYDAISKGKNKGETTLDYLTRLSGIIDDVSSKTFELAGNLSDIFGGDEETKKDIENVQNIFSGAKDLGMGIARAISGKDIVGGIISAVGGIAKISNVFKEMHDKKYEVQIERQQKLVESLKKSYQDLYDTIEKGPTIDMYSQNSVLIENLTKQIDSYRKMISAEYAKKDTDYDKIDDWQNTIDDIYDQIDELYENLKKDLIGDFKSIAEQLGDAIAEAFRNGEDAADAWGEKVNEIIADIIQNLIVTKWLEPKIEDVVNDLFEQAMPKSQAASDAKDTLEDLISQYEEITDKLGNASLLDKIMNSKEWKKQQEELKKKIEEQEDLYNRLNQEAEGEIPNLTEDMMGSIYDQLKNIGDEFTDLPIWDLFNKFATAGGDTMSGLQKGIEGLSEETGEALEALLNSMRYYVADTNADIKNIYNFLVNMPIESPLMQEMKVQSNYLSSINSLLNSVSRNVPSNGKAIKVQIV